MRRLIILMFIAILCNAVQAQKISNTDFDALKRMLTEKAGLYKELVGRFKNADSTLTEADYSVLYYGQCFQKEYNPYGQDEENFDKFKKNYDAQDYSKAIPYALKMLDKDPMNVRMNFKALVCYHYLGDNENKAKMKRRYENLLLAIIGSGDGKTDSTSFVVMRVSDEYELMANMEVEHTVQTLAQTKQGPCDVMSLKPNDLKLEKLYFNVTKLFESMSGMFKDKK